MKGKPVIVSLEMDKPTIMSEFEGSADAILVNFGVQKPSGLGYHQWKSRAFRFVAFADAGRYAYRGGAIRGCSQDMKCYTDSEGHLYDFAFGMNWKGVIDDERVTKYK